MRKSLPSFPLSSQEVRRADYLHRPPFPTLPAGNSIRRDPARFGRETSMVPLCYEKERRAPCASRTEP